MNQVENEKITCITCTLTSDYPGIVFDEKGICNICHQFSSYKHEVMQYFRPYEEFRTIMSENSKKNNNCEYDCLLLYSGGKDSSYVLYRLAKEGYRILTFTFDNGFISQQAFDNIKRVTSELGVANLTYKHDRMNEIFVEDLHANCVVCYGCFLAMNSLAMKVAHEYGISIIISGLSRGQIFETKLKHFFDTNVFDLEKIERSVHFLRKMNYKRKDKIAELLEIDISGDLVDSIQFIDYFRYDDVTISNIKKYLKEMDDVWQTPTDTGLCSTNCLINDVGIYIHQKNKGFHNYVSQLNYDYLLDVSSKTEVNEKINMNLNEKKIQAILNQIGYSN